MKKRISLLIAMALALGCGAVFAETGVSNPWVKTTEDGLMEALGLRFGVPEGATDVTWLILEEEQLAELQFTWYDEDYTARIMPSDEFQDISGMYYDWQQQFDCEIGRCEGICYRAYDGEYTADLCLWYDALTGLMYSVSVVDTDLDGFDITASAQEIYVPMQTE